MKRLYLTLITLAVVTTACHKHDKGGSNTPITQLTGMHIAAPDSSVTLHFIYGGSDTNQLVVQINETDTLHGVVTTDSIVYGYNSSNVLSTVHGYIGTPLTEHIVKYAFYPAEYDLVGYYYVPNDLNNPTEANDVQYDSNTNNITGIIQSFPILTNTGHSYTYYPNGNLLTDTLGYFDNGNTILSSGFYNSYDNQHNYASLLRGLINPSIHNYYFLYFLKNNPTSETVTMYTNNSPSGTATINIAYTYNSQGYPTQSIATNTAGPTVTTTYTYND